MTVLRNFLFLRIITETETHQWLLLAIWCALVVIGLWSLFSQPMDLVPRMLWLALIVLLPVIGLFCYSLRCFFVAEWELLRQLGFGSRTKAKVSQLRS